jgi:hypothetical protein
MEKKDENVYAITGISFMERSSGGIHDTCPLP